MKALVVFTDSKHFLSRFLKKGFTHVFICVNQNGLWLRADGDNWRPDLSYLCEDDFDLAAHYREMGYTVVETHQRDKPVKWPFMMRNCVGMVKSVLCLSNFALTPYSLYRSLK